MKKIDYTDIIGKKFGRLTVLSFNRYNKGFYYYNCMCDCGNTAVVCRNNILRGYTKSCGCLQRETGAIHGKKRKKQIRYMCSFCGERVVYAKNLCRNCYERMRKKGTPNYYIGKQKNKTADIEKQNKRTEWLHSLKPTTELGKLIVERILSGAKILEICKEYEISKQTLYNKIEK